MESKISNIRSLMKMQDISAYIIPSSDPHQSEYVAEYWLSRQWFSGFTGSAGTVVITQDHVGLWTDSRYFIQAEGELAGTQIKLHKIEKSSDHYIQWIKKEILERSTIGLDGRLFSLSDIRSMKKATRQKKLNYKTNIDLITKLWSEGRPALPSNKVFAYDLRYAGTPRKEKIKQLRRKLRTKNADWMLVTTLDDVAWIFNLRGRDVSYNPVFYAFGLIGLEDAYLFIDQDKMPMAVMQELERDNIYIESYEQAYKLRDICFGKTMIDPDTCSVTLHAQFRPDELIEATLPARLLKAQKSKIEVQHIDYAMTKDGVALTHAFKWLEDQLAQGAEVTEYDFAEQIAHCRSQQEGYFGESFPAIIGYNENGAIVHYRPAQNNSKLIKKEGILLCDSGGQYIDGTTDITRTIALDTPTDAQKENYTLVLKGHIALDRIHFPEGTNGSQLDTLARQFLWQYGRNYGHGTGHGVGYFLNVHEGPQGYSPGFSARASTSLVEGMLSSNEPGYYESGSYGIRIENLILVEKSEIDTFLRHRTMTLFPIDTSLIEERLCTAEERAWLNAYHAEVERRLLPFLDEEHQAWLVQKCKKIE